MPSAAFFVDECVARLIVDGLRLRGFDAIDAKDVCRGDNDERVLALAAAAGRVIITHDWGFGELTFRQRLPASGIIILSLYALSAGTREKYAIDRICGVAETCLSQLTIIEPGRIRQRPLPDSR